MELRLFESLKKIVNDSRWQVDKYSWNRFHCPSCGALALQNETTFEIKASEECSVSCPWRILEEFVKENSNDPT